MTTQTNGTISTMSWGEKCLPFSGNKMSNMSVEYNDRGEYPWMMYKSAEIQNLQSEI